MAIGEVVAVTLATSINDLKTKRLQPTKYVTIAVEETPSIDDDNLTSKTFITLDLVETISISYPTEISEKRTSKGRKTDNIHNNPVKVSIKGFISDAYVNVIESAQTVGGVAALGAQFTNFDPYLEAVGIQAAMLLEPPAKNSEAAYNKLKEIRNAKAPVTISTSLETFRGMLIRNITIPISYETGSALHVEIEATAIPFVTSRSVEINLAVIDEKKAAGGGTSNPSDAGSTTPSSQSIAKELFNKFL